MAITTDEHPLARGILANGTRDLFAGAVSSVLSVAYGLSFAALIFSGPLTPWLGYGIAATFLSAAVGAAIVAMRSSLPFTIAGPDSSTSAVTATLVATLLHQLASGGTAGEQLVVPALMVMALGAGLTGLLLCGLGLARAGRAIRFVPYPVIGGFLGATGWVMVTGAVRVITDDPLTIANLHALTSYSNLAKLMAAAGVASALYIAMLRPSKSLALPVILVVFIAAGHLGLILAGRSLAQAQANGWLFEPQAAVGLILPWRPDELGHFPWQAVPALSGELLAVMFVTAISMLLNTAGIELSTRREADLERDLNSLGIANLVSAAFGGYVSCISLSRTTLNYSAGARGRLSGLTVAAISAAVLFANPGFLGYVPKFVLGGLLLYLGLDLMFRWLIESAGRLSRLEYLSLLAITLIIVQLGFIAGVLIGIVIGCATFALSASRANVIKFGFDGSEIRSSLDRNSGELALLAKHGGELQGMSLQSHLFFGSADRLYRHVKTLLADHPDCRFLVFDFRLVTGLDSSVMHSFTQIKHAAGKIGAQLVLVHLAPEIERSLHTRGFIDSEIILAPELDRALESCENEIIAAHRDQDNEVRTLSDWLAAALGSAALAKQLVQLCERHEVAVGDTIARQGEAADCMHFILDGRIGIIAETGDGRSTRLRSLGPHATIGEMGLITRQPRSATIQAEVASVLYSLSSEAYERIARDEPALAQALLRYVIGVMSERLSFASRVISVLRR
jgi:sulfate permease, SulP family